MWQGIGGLAGVIVGKLHAERAGQNRMEPARQVIREDSPRWAGVHGPKSVKVVTRLRGKGSRR